MHGENQLQDCKVNLQNQLENNNSKLVKFIIIEFMEVYHIPGIIKIHSETQYTSVLFKVFIVFSKIIYINAN